MPDRDPDWTAVSTKLAPQVPPHHVFLQVGYTHTPTFRQTVTHQHSRPEAHPLHSTHIFLARSLFPWNKGCFFNALLQNNLHNSLALRHVFRCTAHNTVVLSILTVHSTKVTEVHLTEQQPPSQELHYKFLSCESSLGVYCRTQDQKAYTLQHTDLQDMGQG